MPLFDPFSLFTSAPSLSDDEAADLYANSPIQWQTSVDVTSELNRQSDQGFFSGLFDSGREYLGFATEGLQFLEQFDAGVERVFGEGFLPDNRQAPAAPSLFSAKVAGVPIVLIAIGGGAAVWLATR